MRLRWTKTELDGQRTLHAASRGIHPVADIVFNAALMNVERLSKYTSQDSDAVEAYVARLTKKQKARYP